MTPRFKVIATLVLLLVLGGLGAADYYYSRTEIAANITNPDATNPEPQTPAPDGAVAKQQGPNVESVATELGFTMQSTDDPTLLGQIVTGGPAVQSFDLLMDNDRAGSVIWVESSQVKNYYFALKEALLTAFSPEVTDLRDETLQNAGTPVRNLLTFMDPALSEERLVFIRVRERLYEFHIAASKEDVMNQLIETVTTR